MLEMNPYTYGSAEYYRSEMEAAKLNFRFVICGAVAYIKDCDWYNEQELIVSACEAVIIANEQYKSAMRRYKEALTEGGTPNE